MKNILIILKKGLFFILFIVSSLDELTAQQTPIYSQYMLNGFLINPALAGVDGYQILNLISRQQWVGYEDYPRTNWLSYQTRILKHRYLLRNLFGKKKYKPKTSGKIGFGAYLYNDRTGVINRNGGQISYAYHTFINNKNTQLSLGISAQFYQMMFNRNQMILSNDNDPFLNAVSNKNYFIPDFSVGANLLGKTYYFGITAAQLLQSKYIINGYQINGYNNPRIYYLLAGYTYYLNQNYVLEPSLLANVNEQFNYLATFTLKVTYNNTFWMGASVRTNKDIVYIIGFKYLFYYFSMAYDYPLTSLSSQNYGTYELSVSIKYGSSEKRLRWKERY